MGFELPFVIGPEYIAVALFGVVIGIIFGAIPGMTATMAVAVFLPLTYAYSMEMALYLLLGLYVGGISGGLVPAILINIPGTPSSVCTTFDGHPMALRGEGERALKIGVTSSFMGGMISLVVLALFTPILAGWAIKFSAVEKFLIILFALTVIAALSRGQMLRGLWIGMLGVLVAMMNQFSVNNEYRMVPEFLESQMQSGFQLFPVLIGLFAVSEMLQQCETGMHASYSKDDTLEVKNNVKFSLLHDFKGQIINVFRSALLGTFMGILPGVGGSAASLIAYSQAKSWSKHPELLGTGVPEGLIASESSNNGLTGGALVPLLSLGIPGDSTTAVLIGAFMLQGIQVGPLFITNNPVIWNTILVALLCCNTVSALMLFQGGFQRFYNIQENHHLIGTAIRKEQGDFFAGAPFSADDLLHQKPVGRYAQSIGDKHKGVKAHALDPALYVADVRWRFIHQFREHRLRKVVALTDFTDVFSNDFVVQAHNKTSKKFCSLIIVFRLYHQLDLISISPQVDILLEIDNLENIFEGGSR